MKHACNFLAIFFHQSLNSFIHTILQIEFVDDGICHGFAVWIDWVLDKENSIVISTGPGKDDVHPCGAVYSCIYLKILYSLGFATESNGHLLIDVWLLSSESRYWKQGVQLLSKPIQVNPANLVMHIEAHFDAEIGELAFKSTTLL